jgi:hypothetical protein
VHLRDPCDACQVSRWAFANRQNAALRYLVTLCEPARKLSGIALMATRCEEIAMSSTEARPRPLSLGSRYLGQTSQLGIGRSSRLRFSWSFRVAPQFDGRMTRSNAGHRPTYRRTSALRTATSGKCRRRCIGVKPPVPSFGRATLIETPPPTTPDVPNQILVRR